MAAARRSLRHIVFGAQLGAGTRFYSRFNVANASADRCIAKHPLKVHSLGEKCRLRRFSQAATSIESPMRRFTDRLIQGLGSVAIKDRIHLEALSPPLPPSPPPRITVEDSKKFLHAAQMQALHSMLRSMPDDCISYDEFLGVCEECVGGSNPDRAKNLAKRMDESGSVIVLGDFVHLRPEQVVRAFERMIPARCFGAEELRRREELELMEKEKAEIDAMAARGVRRELWCGLGYLVVQTAAFMRLTFWELSWDVMEPICFYVTSVYFMAGYAFFLRTSRDPSFEGFFASRFNTKQQRLMERRNFDLDRFNQLRRSLRPFSTIRLSPPPHPRADDSASFSPSLLDVAARR